MFQVPTCVFDHCIRSCLTFKEQHESRRVAKAWTDLSAVTKVIDRRTPFHKISPHANFRNVTSFHAYGADSNVHCLQITHKIFSQSRNSLKSILLVTDFLLFVPISFPNVITLDFEGKHSTFAKLLSACPNLQDIDVNLDPFQESLPRLSPHANVEKIRLYTEDDGVSDQAISYFLRNFPLAKTVEFSIWGEEYTVNFADCPSAETFKFNESDIFYVNFENLEMSFLKSIEIEVGDDPDFGITLDDFPHIAYWILRLPSVRFSFPIWLIDEEDDSCGWFLIVVHESKLWFKNWMCDIATEKCAAKFAETMKSILSIRDYVCHIDMKGQEAEKFKAVVTASHVFDENKLE